MPLEIKKLIFLLILLISNISEAKLLPSNSINSATGLILNPNARFQNEGNINIGTSYFEPFNKISLTAAPYDWFEASVYYTDINVRRYYPGSEQSYKDKGFSFKFKIKDETSYLPQIAVGFEDIAGTSLFKSEYIVFSKIYKNFDFTFGYASGFLGSEGNASNFIRSGSREKWDFSTGGEVGLNDLFKGESSFFGGVEYLIPTTNFWSAKVEYDASTYEQNYDLLPNLRKYQKKSNLNYSLMIPYKNSSLTLAYLNQEIFAVSFNMRFDISRKKK